MSREQIEARIKQVTVEQLGVNADQVVAGAKFAEDLWADELDMVELVMAFEEEFGVEIPDEEGEKLATVSDAADYLEKRLAVERRLSRLHQLGRQLISGMTPGRPPRAGVTPAGDV